MNCMQISSYFRKESQNYLRRYRRKKTVTKDFRHSQSRQLLLQLNDQYEEMCHMAEEEENELV